MVRHAEAAGAKPAASAGGRNGGAFGAVMDNLTQFIHSLPEWAIFALVAVVAAAAGTLIGLSFRRRPPPPAPETSGETPLIAPPKGTVEPTPENPAFKAYQEILEGKELPATEVDARMREFAGQFKEMRETLRDLAPAATDLEAAVEEARDALDAGRFERASDLLVRIGDSESHDGLEKRNQATRHLMAACRARVVAGDLKLAGMQPVAAAELYGQAIQALPPAEEELHAKYLNKHGTACYQAGEHQTAIASFERSLEILQRTLGRNHPDVASGLNNLALLHYSLGHYEAAEPLYKRSLAIDEQTLGIDHPGVATDLNNLALLYKRQGNLEAAEPLLRRALDIKEKNFDPGHPSLVTGLKNYASTLIALGREEEAQVFLAKAETLPPTRTDAAE